MRYQTRRTVSSIELVIFGLLAALLVVLAVPVVGHVTGPSVTSATIGQPQLPPSRSR